MSNRSLSAAVIAVCAAGACFNAPSASAAPADPGCASLQQLGPDLSDTATKFNAFNSTVSQLPGQYQQTDLLGMVQNMGAAGQKAQELVTSLNQTNSDIQDAENNTQDPGLHDNLDQLSDTVSQASEYVGSYANPFAQRPDNSKLTGFAVRLGTLLISYQINYTRVCGIGQFNLPGMNDQNNPAVQNPAVQNPAASNPAAQSPVPPDQGQN